MMNAEDRSGDSSFTGSHFNPRHAVARLLSLPSVGACQPVRRRPLAAAISTCRRRCACAAKPIQSELTVAMSLTHKQPEEPSATENDDFRLEAAGTSVVEPREVLPAG